MAKTTTIPTFLITPLLLLLIHHTSAATTTAPSPTTTPTKPINLTEILSTNGAFTRFLYLLNTTQVLTQIPTQLNSSTEGMTLFAPTDNAFRILKGGTLNNLTSQQQVQLVLYHVLPKFYSWADFETVSNPVQTQASGNGGNWGLQITSFGVQQVNVSTGTVTTQLNNALRLKFPLAVYQVEAVLIPKKLYEVDAPAPESDSSSSGDKKKSPGTAKSSAASPGAADKAADKNSSTATVVTSVWGLVVGLCVGIFML